MFKRLLVLVLFVTGVFWWLTNRTGEEKIYKETTQNFEVISPEQEVALKDSLSSQVDEDSNGELEELESDLVISDDDKEPESISNEVFQQNKETKIGVETSETNTVTVDSVVAAPLVKATEPKVGPTSIQPVTRPESASSVRQPSVLKVPAHVTKTVTNSDLASDASESITGDFDIDVSETSIESELETAPAKNYADRSVAVRAYLYEWGLDFSSKRIEAGNVTFSVINSGKFPHAFNIRDVGDLGVVPAQGRAQFTVYLEPGTYEVYSDRRSDYQRGIKDYIKVIE